MKIRSKYMNFLSQWGHLSRFAMALCWLIGLLLGFCAAKSAAITLTSAVDDTIYGGSSFFRILLSCILPFAISYIALRLQERWLLWVYCLWKAFCFSYCAVGVGLAFGSAAWLMRVLLLFSDVFCIPALLLFWFGFCRYGAPSKRATICFVIYASTVAYIDYFYVLPLLCAVVS